MASATELLPLPGCVWTPRARRAPLQSAARIQDGNVPLDRRASQALPSPSLPATHTPHEVLLLSAASHQQAHEEVLAQIDKASGGKTLWRLAA